MTLPLFLAVLGLVLLLLAAIKPIPDNPWLHLGWLGLFFWFLATILK